jgi:hypothetical protein
VRCADHPHSIPWISRLKLEALAVAGSIFVAHSAVTATVIYYSLKLQGKLNMAAQQDKKVKEPKQVKWTETEEVREFDEYEAPNAKGWPSTFQPVVTERPQEPKKVYELGSPEECRGFLAKWFDDSKGKLWSPSPDSSSK